MSKVNFLMQRRWARAQRAPRRYLKRRCPEPGCAAGTVRLYAHPTIGGRSTYVPVLDMCPRCGALLPLLDADDGEPLDPRQLRGEARRRMAGGELPRVGRPPKGLKASV